MEISDLEPLVGAGARLLDNKQPGWYNKFTPKELRDFNPHDSCHDVLGVVFGTFYRGVEILFQGSIEEKFKQAQAHGFDFDRKFEQEYNDQMVSELWVDLEVVWREEIAKRQENGVPDGTAS